MTRPDGLVFAADSVDSCEWLERISDVDESPLSKIGCAGDGLVLALDGTIAEHYSIHTLDNRQIQRNIN